MRKRSRKVPASFFFDQKCRENDQLDRRYCNKVCKYYNTDKTAGETISRT